MELSKRIQLARPLATIALHGRVEESKARGQQIIDLSIALSNHPPVDADAARAADGLHTTRMPNTTVIAAERLRASLASEFHSENHIDMRVDEIIVKNGARQAVHEALYALADPDDEAIIFRLYWLAYIAAVELLGLRSTLAGLSVQNSASTLAALPRAKAVIINNPQ